MADTPGGIALMDYPQLNGEFKFNDLAWLVNLIWTGIKDRDASAPPGSPGVGDAYLIKATASGDWLGHDGEFAIWRDSAWQFIAPVEGNVIRVNDEDVVIHYNGTTWNQV